MYRQYRTKYWNFYVQSSLVPVIKSALDIDNYYVPDITSVAVNLISATSSSYITDSTVPVGRTIVAAGIPDGTTVTGNIGTSLPTTTLYLSGGSPSGSLAAYTDSVNIATTVTNTSNATLVLAEPVASGENQLYVNTTDLTYDDSSTYTITQSGIPTGTTITDISTTSIPISVLTLASETGVAIAVNTSLTLTSTTSVSQNTPYTTYADAASGAQSLEITGSLAYDSTKVYKITGTGIPDNTTLTGSEVASGYTTIALSAPITADIATGASVTITAVTTTTSTESGVVAVAVKATDNTITIFGSAGTSITSVSGGPLTSTMTVSSGTSESMNVDNISLSANTTAYIPSGASLAITISKPSTTTSSFRLAKPVSANSGSVMVLGSVYVDNGSYTIEAGNGFSSNVKVGSTLSINSPYNYVTLSSPVTEDIPAGTVLTLPGKAASIVLPEGSTWSLEDSASITDNTGIMTLVVKTSAMVVSPTDYIVNIIDQIKQADPNYTFAEKSYQVLPDGFRIVLSFTSATSFSIGSPLFEDNSGMENTIVKTGNQVYINSAKFNANGNII